MVQVEETPEDYCITDDYTDEALRFIQGTRASAPREQRPFFLYSRTPRCTGRWA